jgi:hypothetical protein
VIPNGRRPSTELLEGDHLGWLDEVVDELGDPDCPGVRIRRRWQWEPVLLGQADRQATDCFG